MYWSKFSQLEVLRKNGILVPKSYVFSEYDDAIDFSFVEKQFKFPLILRSSYDLEDWEFLFPWVFKSFFPIYTKEAFIRYKNLILKYKEDYLYKEYININNIDVWNHQMNIIVQEYIIWEYSWIVFIDDDIMRMECIPWLNNLLTSNNINSSFKVTVDIKSGNIKVTDFFIDKFFLTIINHKKTMKKFDNSFLIEEFIIQNYLEGILELCKKIKSIFNCPQDIEFTIRNNSIYILQSRGFTP